MSSPEGRPCTLFPRSEDVPPQDGQIRPTNQNTHDRMRRSPTVDHNIDSTTKNKYKPDKRGNRDHISYKRPSDDDDTSNKRTAAQFCKERSPWASYKRFATLGPSETTFLAVGPHPTTTIVAIKEQRVSKTAPLRGIVSTSHVNVVKLQDAYYWSGTCFFVYDRMDISLEQLCVCNRIEDIHIATICREVGLLNLYKLISGTANVLYLDTLWAVLYLQ